MNLNVKSGGVALAQSPQGFYRVAIVGAASLKGKEVAEVLEQRNFPSTDIKLLDDDETLGQLEAVKDEITFIQSVREEQFERVDFTFFASDADCTRKTWKKVKESGSAIIDLSYALEDDATAMLRAPWVERQLGYVAKPELQPGPAVVAHPVSIALALVLGRLHAAVRIKRATATIFEPVSEYGQKGMDELHEQTVNLLSFQQLTKKTFDTQVAFNLVSHYGEQALTPLSSVTRRIEKHYQRIIANRAPTPSIFLLQAPTFHGHVFAMNLQFETTTDLDRVHRAMEGDHISILRSPDELPNNVNAAGQENILVSLTADSSDPSAAWIWAAFDNLRVAAMTAVECAEAMAAARPRGQIQ